MSLKIFKAKVENFKREELKKLLIQCTEKQQAFFGRLYKSVEEIPEDRIPRAVQQIEATIKINNEKKKGGL